MDEARRLLGSSSPPLAVAAARQTNGRGTRGRTWQDGAGNVMLTVAVRGVPVTSLSLVPPRVGTLVHDVLAANAPACALRVKWPNDVLLAGGKLAGTLIEMDDGVLLIGVGVNVRHAPIVPDRGDDRGRPSAALAACAPVVPDAATLARELADAIVQWSAQAHDDTVVADWSQRADWTTPLAVREDSAQRVLPIRLLDDGRLQVRDLATGALRDLVADYLY